MRALAWFHRWLGVATCLVFALWFASGAVLLFVPFPSLSRSAQLALEAPVSASRVALAPVQALSRSAPDATALRLVQRGGHPAYIAKTPRGTVAIDAQTGAPLALLTRGAAVAEARRLLGPGAAVRGPFDYDQWVVHDRLDPARPFFRLDAHDTAGTQLYLSAGTGELVQRTTRAERGWNWVGAVLHWAYVTPLRSSWSAWDTTVWWVSLVGLLVAVAGTVLGIVRLLAARRLRPARFSFYRDRWMRWHHLLGLGTALFVLTWTFSGWLSMDHGRLFSRGTLSAIQAGRYAGCPLAVALRQIDRSALRPLDAAPEFSLSALACTPILVRHSADGTAARFDGTGAPLGDTAMQQRVRAAAAAAWPGSVAPRIGPVDPTSTYALAEGWPASAWRVQLGDKRPDLYVDGASGSVLTVLDGSRAAYAWAYYALHTFNVPGLTTHPVLRKAVVLVPLVAGFIFSLTGVVLGWRRLRRLGGKG
jgi:hypothetical protein